MSIETLITLIIVCILCLVLLFASYIDERNRKIKGTYSGYRPLELKIFWLITNLIVCIFIAISGWLALATLASIIIHDTYNKDKSIVLEYETEYVDNIIYNGSYEIDSKYTLGNDDKVYVIDDNRPYVKYPTRIKIGPFYYDTDSELSLFSDVELYIPKEVEDRIENIKENSAVYTSNNE